MRSLSRAVMTNRLQDHRPPAFQSLQLHVPIQATTHQRPKKVLRMQREHTCEQFSTEIHPSLLVSGETVVRVLMRIALCACPVLSLSYLNCSLSEVWSFTLRETTGRPCTRKQKFVVVQERAASSAYSHESQLFMHSYVLSL